MEIDSLVWNEQAVKESETIILSAILEFRHQIRNYILCGMLMAQIRIS